jgi:NAD(P)-dependent dehydrogenase (short-subunit alcohol dehydrogenase family)
MEEEQQIQSESRADVRPLHLDVVDSLGTRDAMERFNNILLRPHVAFSGASPHNLTFRALILVPDLIYPSGPIETISPELWSDALNAKVLNTIAIAQAFLPTVCGFKARVLMLTPNIVAALRPPFHSVETAVVNALDGFTASLRGELGTLGIDVCQFKLGTFDCSNVGGKHLQTIGSPNTDLWPTAARMSYGANYVNQTRVARSRGLLSQQNGSSGSSLRELHKAVFDALTQKHPRRVWHVGRGSVTYEIVGNWLPSGLVGWMLGVRRVSLNSMGEPQLEDSVTVQSWEKVETV